MWGPPESPELASVTNELAPTLGPELGTLFKTELLTSPESGPMLARGLLGIECKELPKFELSCEFPATWDCTSPWKNMPELEDDCGIPPTTRDGTIGGNQFVEYGDPNYPELTSQKLQGYVRKQE